MADLQTFRAAHDQYFQTALAEIKAGRKKSHWMWFIFPQIQGLGRSETAKYYALKDLHEAADFLNDPVLGKNYLEICEALIDLPTSDVTAVLGYPDDLKLQSSLTLFAMVPGADARFEKLLEKFYSGQKDLQTLSRIQL